MSTPDTGAVERFGFAFHSIRFPNLAVGTIEKNEAGDYVRYTDYERVVAERDRLAEALKWVKSDCETCDWECAHCGRDYGMTGTDLYMETCRALAARGTK